MLSRHDWLVEDTAHFPPKMTNPQATRCWLNCVLHALAASSGASGAIIMAAGRARPPALLHHLSVALTKYAKTRSGCFIDGRSLRFLDGCLADFTLARDATPAPMSPKAFHEVALALQRMLDHVFGYAEATGFLAKERGGLFAPFGATRTLDDDGGTLRVPRPSSVLPVPCAPGSPLDLESALAALRLADLGSTLFITPSFDAELGGSVAYAPSLAVPLPPALCAHGSAPASVSYELRCVVVRRAELGADDGAAPGAVHCWAFVKRGSQWFKCDDDQVTMVSVATVERALTVATQARAGRLSRQERPALLSYELFVDAVVASARPGVGHVLLAHSVSDGRRLLQAQPAPRLPHAILWRPPQALAQPMPPPVQQQVQQVQVQLMQPQPQVQLMQQLPQIFAQPMQQPQQQSQVRVQPMQQLQQQSRVQVQPMHPQPQQQSQPQVQLMQQPPQIFAQPMQQPQQRPQVRVQPMHPQPQQQPPQQQQLMQQPQQPQRPQQQAQLMQQQQQPQQPMQQPQPPQLMQQRQQPQVRLLAQPTQQPPVFVQPRAHWQPQPQWQAMPPQQPQPLQQAQPLPQMQHATVWQPQPQVQVQYAQPQWLPQPRPQWLSAQPMQPKPQPQQPQQAQLMQQQPHQPQYPPQHQPLVQLLHAPRPPAVAACGSLADAEQPGIRRPRAIPKAARKARSAALAASRPYAPTAQREERAGCAIGALATLAEAADAVRTANTARSACSDYSSSLSEL